VSSSVEPCPVGQIEGMSVDGLLRAELVPIATAAESLGIEPKRLLGYMFRNQIGDPIGDGLEVYGWSCATLAKRIADHASGGVS
jgi:hypothetical protein